MRQTWKLNTQYKNCFDKKIDTDLDYLHDTFVLFRKKYHKKDFTKSEKSLSKALDDYFSLFSNGAYLIPQFLLLHQSLQTNNKKLQARISVLQQKITEIFSILDFFFPEFKNITTKKQKQFLKAKILTPYHYYLRRAFSHIEHVLTPEIETILSTKSLPAQSLWVQMTQDFLASKTLTYKNETKSINEWIELLDTYSKEDRSILWVQITDNLKEIGEAASYEMSAIYLNKKINDSLRSYSTPYEATIKSYQNDPETVQLLVDTVTKKGFEISKDFYRTLAKDERVKQLSYTDRIISDKGLYNYSFKETFSLCRRVFSQFDTDLGAYLHLLYKNGCIDVYPRPGKRGGAFMSGVSGGNEYIFLNHTNSLSSVLTFAHEAGHAVHHYLTKKQQPVHYQGYSTVSAETASTFFEQLVWYELYNSASSDTEKKYLLKYRISSDVATIMRQIAFYNFELEAHTILRNQGLLNNKQLATLFTKHMKTYLGTAVQCSVSDGYSYVYVGHFRRMFYVYAYSYGHIASNTMLKKYIEDANYKEYIINFLSSGQSETVETLYKMSGLDPYKKDFFENGLKTVEANLKEYKKFIASSTRK